MAKHENVVNGNGLESRLQLVLEQDPGRAALERFLHDRYARAFDAHLAEFLPWLVEMRNGSNSVVGAIGLRSAAAGPLFLERYLAVPAEQAVASAAGTPASRNTLVEIGNFAADSPGALRFLIVSLIDCLHRAGLQWALFTLLPMARNAFTRLGLPLIPLAEARPDCLAPADRAAWGAYYDHKPWVMAGCLAQGHRILKQNARPIRGSSICGAVRAAPAWV